jgi:flagella basal body P-ring formation protein FlgA
VLNKKKWKAGYNDVLVELNQEGCSPVRKNYAMHVNIRNNVEILKKGSSVTVVLKKGLLKITAPGTVLEDSFVNQETTVRVHVSQRVLKTVVKSLNEVEMIW